MRVLTILVINLIIFSFIFSQQNSSLEFNEYIIAENETKNIPSGTTLLIVEKLVMGNNSKLIIPKSAKKFELIVKKSAINKNSKIIGRNIDQKDGIDLKIDLGDASIKGLEIITKGYDGDRGSKGHNGRNGRDASCTSGGTNGTSGGKGGTGGKGGDGGNILLSLEEGSTPINISLKPEGGLGGKGGDGGQGGRGGRGKNCGLYKKGGGANGNPGATGSNGPNGKTGKYKIIKEHYWLWFWQDDEEFEVLNLTE